MVLVCVLILLMAPVKADAASAEIVSVRSGDVVLLNSDLQELEENWDIRWLTQSTQLISRKSNRTKCPDRSCEVLRNGSLRFNQVQPMNAGNYCLVVYDENGSVQQRKDFVLSVEDQTEDTSSSSGSSSSNGVVPVLICFFLLLISSLVLLFFVRRRGTLVTKTTTEPPEENVYVTMHGNRGNQEKDGEKQEKEEEKEEKEEKEEESPNVRRDPLVSMETPDTQRMSMGIEDIYV